MSLGDYIRYCKCNRLILTTGQIEENKPCKLCQEEAKQHAKEFKQRFEQLQKEEG